MRVTGPCVRTLCADVKDPQVRLVVSCLLRTAELTPPSIRDAALQHSALLPTGTTSLEPLSSAHAHLSAPRSQRATPERASLAPSRPQVGPAWSALRVSVVPCAPRRRSVAAQSLADVPALLCVSSATLRALLDSSRKRGPGA